MNIRRIVISNFRGIKSATILLNGNGVFVGDNNSGKSTIFEAVDLVRRRFIEEFYQGYIAPQTRGTKQNKTVQKQMEVLIKTEELLINVLKDGQNKWFIATETPFEDQFKE